MIRISHYIAGALAAAAWAGAAGADTLTEALAAAYTTNPVLEAQRAQLRATQEDLAQARASRLPTVTGNASIGRQGSESSGTIQFFDPPQTFSNSSESTPKTYSLTLSQPVWRGGIIGAGIDRVEASIAQQEALLDSAEQQVMLDAVAAYMDVLRAARVVEIRINNVDVLSRQGEAASARFDLGEVTRTDVAQAQSRLALSRADLSTAQAALQQQRAAFERIVGFPPGTLEEPPALPSLPDMLEQAERAALANNPDLAAAAWAAEAARHNIRVARSDLLPSIDIDGSVQRRDDGSFAGDRTDSYSIVAGVRIPLFSGGLEQSQVRQARQQAERAEFDMERVRRETLERVTGAWSSWLAAQEVVRSAEAAVEASDLAFEGVEREASVGLRQTLDVLDAEQEALAARVTLAGAERDAYVAAHQLLAAMGMLNVNMLDVPVAEYDPEAYGEDIRWNLFGTSIR